MYKILFTDIDGTLLNKERIISPATKKEIFRLNTEKRIPVILISSRMPKAMKPLHDELELEYPIISYNGALILKSSGLKDDSDILFSTTIKPEIVKNINEFKSMCDFHISLYYNDDWYVEGMDYWADREITSTKVVPSIGQHEVVIKDWEIKKVGAHKVMCMGNAMEIEKLHEWLFTKYPGVLNLYRSKPTFIEITPNIVSKATALEYMLDYLNVDSSETIAIGDNYNDLDMLNKAGLGIAMGNAPAAVRKAADYITLSNNDDGLAAAIRKFFN